jgi:hypothetical protein
MQQVVCESCQNTFPKNGMFLVVGRSLCESCANQFLAQRGAPLQKGEIVRQIDSTVCGRCKADTGVLHAHTVGELPVCDECYHTVYHRPFPLWVKWAAAGVLALAVVSMMVNGRFLLGFVEARRAMRAFQHGHIARAADLMQAAGEHIPEVGDFGDIGRLFRGLECLSGDRCDEAIPLLRGAATQFPPESDLWRLARNELLLAEGGAAFKAKDYDAFLAKQSDYLQQFPGNSWALASVASAHACKYAVTGEARHKQESLRYLEEATQGRSSAEIDDYRQRILHRLQTREIITGQEFHRRYPQGWTAEKKS